MTTGTVLHNFNEPAVPDEDRGVPAPNDDHLTVLAGIVEPTVPGTEPDSADSRPSRETLDGPCLSCMSEP